MGLLRNWQSSHEIIFWKHGRLGRHAQLRLDLGLASCIHIFIVHTPLNISQGVLRGDQSHCTPSTLVSPLGRKSCIFGHLRLGEGSIKSDTKLLDRVQDPQP